MLAVYHLPSTTLVSPGSSGHIVNQRVPVPVDQIANFTASGRTPAVFQNFTRQVNLVVLPPVVGVT